MGESEAIGWVPAGAAEATQLQRMLEGGGTSQPENKGKPASG